MVNLIKNLIRKKRKVQADLALAKLKATEEMKQLKFVRAMLPVSIEETPDKIIINDNIFIRCYVLGIQRGMRAGFPTKLDDAVLEELGMLSSENAIISYCFEVVPIPTHESLQQTEEAIYAMNCSLTESKEKDQNLMDISIIEDRKSAIEVGKILHAGSKFLSATTIISVTTRDLNELNQIEVKMSQILNKFSIEYDIPKYRMMEAYRATLLLPVHAEDFSVELLPDYASQLTCMSNPNSTTAETGFIAGIDRITGKAIIVDPSVTLHAGFIGATGSGKTVMLLTHLIRAMTILGLNGVFVTSKAESMTDFRNVAAELNEISAVIDIGRHGKHNINPLQIMFRGLPDDYTYSSHLGLILQFFNTMFRQSGSQNMDAEIVVTIRDLYETRGITHDPKTWEDATWPNLSDLHQYWIELSKKEPGNLSLKALISKTAQVDEMWKFLLKPTNVDLTKQFLVFDLSDCPSDIQDAVNVFCVGLLMQMFSKRVGGDKGTIVACDEAGKLLESESFANYIADILRLGRSAGLTGWFATQSIADWSRNEKVGAMMKANLFANYVFGKNMRPENLTTTKNYFALSEREVKWLLGNGPGDCIARIDSMTAPIHNTLTEWEDRVILRSNAEGKTLLETESGDVFSLIHPALKALVDKHGIILSAWTDEQPYSLGRLGYESRNIQHCVGGGRHNVWVKKGLINANNMMGRESVEHKGSTLEIAGELVMNGLPAVVNVEEGVDISTTIDGIKVGFEFQLSKISPQVLKTKLEKGLKDHSEVYFVCTSAIKEEVTEVVGASNTIPRGRDFAEFLKERLRSTKTPHTSKKGE